MELEEYLNYHHTRETTKSYLRKIKTFCFLQKHPEQCTYQEILDYLGELRKRYTNRSTLQTHLLALKRYYDYLQDTNQREDHPCKYIHLRGNQKRDIQLQDLFTEEELECLLTAKTWQKKIQIRNQVLISLLIYQGLTTGEIVQLYPANIDLEKAEVYVRGTGITNSRTLKLREKQIMLFYKYLNGFHVKKGGATKSLAKNRDGIEYLISTLKYLYSDRNLNPKTIRQSVITNKLKQGNDLRKVQVFAGHKLPSTTAKYKQQQVEELKNEVLKYHPLQ